MTMITQSRRIDGPFSDGTVRRRLTQRWWASERSGSGGGNRNLLQLTPGASNYAKHPAHGIEGGGRDESAD
jgi:hypothetical protein